MTSRLEQAIKQLTPTQVDELADFAEFLASREDAQRSADQIDMSWVGCMSDSADASGVDAVHRINKERIGMLAINADK